MSYVSRDPFAREEVHCSTVPAHGTCGWCGNPGREERRKGQPTGRRLLREYRVETDGGRTYAIPGQFCSVGCMCAYHG